MKSDNKKQKAGRYLIWVILLALALIAVVAGLLWNLNNEADQPTNPSQQPTESWEAESMPTETYPEAQIQKFDSYLLDSGLQIVRIDDYAGIYMEDGSNESVSDVMMIIVENTTDRDIQLARIQVTYEQLQAEFEATNLPAGAMAVLLERNRTSRPNTAPLAVSEDNVVFFEESMDTMEDVFEITGLDGALNVRNISGEDMEGNIYIYYKNSAADLFYGGITYRVKIEGGIAAGEVKQVMTGHFDPKGSLIVAVTTGA